MGNKYYNLVTMLIVPLIKGLKLAIENLSFNSHVVFLQLK